MQQQQPAYLTKIVIQKERQRQKNQKIRQHWKHSLKQFYSHQIKHKLREGGATKQQQQSIYQLFIRKDTRYKIQFHPYQLGELQILQDEIQSLASEYNKIQQQSKRKLKKCEPITNIIKFKCSTLQTIVIQYKQNNVFQALCYSAYSMSAFEFIKVINSNKNLNSVILKGVQVQKFQDFISLMYKIKNNQQLSNKDSEQESWIKNFQPSKSLKLAIDCQFLFRLINKSQTESLLKHLAYFLQLIQSLSDIKVQVHLGNWMQIYQWRNDLQLLWKQLRLIKRLKLQIIAQNRILKELIPLVRTLIFGGIATFTDISGLFFIGIQFIDQGSINDLLAMEQILAIIFLKNPICHFKLYNHLNFPLLPQIKTLQSICITDCCFRKNNNFMGEIIAANKSLKSIKCFKIMSDNWEIDDHLFNQLQFLSLWNCRIIFKDIDRKKPSNIRHLSISNIYYYLTVETGTLQLLFPKLINLTYLQLYYVDIEANLICTISSPYLEELHIFINNNITNSGLKELDSNWPFLRNMTLSNCKSINEMAWNMCEFKGLMNLKIDNRMLGKEKEALTILINKGIKVNY